MSLFEKLRKVEQPTKSATFSTAVREVKPEDLGLEQTSIEFDLPAWPDLPDAALHGLAGDIVREATKDSEADPAAVLITTLVYAGAAFGAQCFVSIGDTRHPPRLMSAVVGASSRARKGTSTNPVTRIFDAALDQDGLTKLQVSHGPLSSGEGLIYAVRDPSEKKDKDGKRLDEGAADKRLLVIEGELGSAFQAMLREGNTLSAIIRTAWDHGNIAPLTKNNPIKATAAHVSILGHITRNELSALLQKSDIWNGFANRFLWVCARRQKMIPFPQPMDRVAVDKLASQLAGRIRNAQTRGRVNFNPEAAEIWQYIYPELSRDLPGVFGVVTARGEAQVRRLALVYSLLAGSDMICPEHLKSALAIWNYCRDSARYIFGGAEVDPNANRVLCYLKDGEKTQSQLNNLFNGHLPEGRLRAILSELQSVGRITQSKQGGGGKGKGRPKTVWSLATGFLSPGVELESLED